MKSRQDKRQRALLLAILISLLFHAIIMITPLHWLKSTEKSEEPFIVQRITLPKDKGQVVDQTPEANKLIPKESKYLSQFNNQVEEETRAPIVAEPKEPRPPKPAAPQVTEKKPSEEKETTLAMKDKEGKKSPGKKPKLSWDDLTTLARSQEQPSQPTATDDYLPDTKVGDQNMLNTREFLYYSYYARIKERLRMFWTPSIRPVMARLYHAGQEVNGSGELITKVRVTLNSDGSLTNIRVLEGSGFKELDDVAIYAFEKAAPFPNPPSGMVEKNGNVYLRWDFILTTNSGPRIRVLLSRR